MTSTERARKMIAGMMADGWDVSAIETLLTDNEVMLEALERVIAIVGGCDSGCKSDVLDTAWSAIEKVRGIK